jgi:hypothetical protein
MNNPEPWWLTWPVAEVAAAILPFLSSTPCQNERVAIASIISWWKTGEYQGKVDYTRPIRFTDPDTRAVAEAIQVLERAGLVMRDLVLKAANPSVRFEIGLTRLGVHAIETNTVRENLGLGDAPPAA